MNKPKQVILFPEVPELTWVENKEWKYGCFNTDCKNRNVGIIKFREQRLSGYTLCLEHTKPFAVKILKSISDELDNKEACRQAYKKIVKR